MKGLEEWLPPVSAGTKTGLQTAQVHIVMLSKKETALWLWDRAAKFPGSFEPFRYHDFNIGKSHLPRAPSAAHPGSSGTSAMKASSSSLQYRTISYFVIRPLLSVLVVASLEFNVT